MYIVIINLKTNILLYTDHFANIWHDLSDLPGGIILIHLAFYKKMYVVID